VDTYAEPRLFLRIVEAGSLRAAAVELGVEPSAVTRRLAALERRLGAKLIVRSRTRSRPTDAGVRYYQRMKGLLAEVDALEAEIGGTAVEPTGILRVTAPGDFGVRFVAPVLREMAARFPRLEVDLRLGSGLADLAEQGIDVAIRIGPLRDSALIARKLGEIPRVVVASPDYLERHGVPKAPQELTDHESVFYLPHRPGAVSVFDGSDGPVEVPLKGRIAINNISAIVDLVEDGAGIHIGPIWAFYDAIEQGRVVQLLAEFPITAFPLHALYVETSYVPAKIRWFIDEMARRARHIPGL